MGIKVIGAGIGRTGTESLKLALEQLGFGKCYHMTELIKNPHHLAEWEKLEAGAQADYDKFFAGYGAAVDFPSFVYYKDLLQHYPDAKVILTLRDADQWYRSALKTIFRPVPKLLFLLIRIFGLFSKRAKMFPSVYAYTLRVGHQQFFKGKVTDPDHCKAIFNAWNEEVRRTIPPEKLLIFTVKQGWKPLCRFLDVPIPTSSFPHANKGESFQKNTSKTVLSSGK